MRQVLVTNMDDRVIAALRYRADLHGHSLEDELRAILITAARLTSEQRVELSRRIRALTPTGVAKTDSAELIRQDRDAR